MVQDVQLDHLDRGYRLCPRVSGSTSREVAELGWVEDCAWKGVWGGEADSACNENCPSPHNVVFENDARENNGVVVMLMQALSAGGEDVE